MLIWSSCNQPEKPISFGVLADCQYCDCPPVGSRFYRNSPAKLREAMNDLRNRDLDFTVHLGDLIDRNYSSYDSVLPIVSRLRNFYHVLGNHDFSVTDDEKQQVLHKIGLEKGWYDFSLRGWRFIVLDGNDISLYSSTDSLKTKQALNRIAQLKSDGAPNANDWNGAIGSEQLQWMEGAIQDAGKKGEQVILFCHFPIGPADAHNLLNDVEVRTVLEKYDHVVAWLNGHNHKGHFEQKNNQYFITLPGMVETEDTNAWGVVTLYPDSLIVSGSGRTPDLKLPIKKKN